jgi:hypothetical protein
MDDLDDLDADMEMETSTVDPVDVPGLFIPNLVFRLKKSI